MAATIRDVARRAGVAVSTVSHIFNGSPLAGAFTAETRERVEKAIRDLRYFPSASGRNLAKRRHETIGLALASGEEGGVGSGLARGSFYADVLGGIESACFASNYLLMLSLIPCGSQKVPPFLQSKSVDGCIMVHQLNRETLETAQQSGIPLLNVNANPERGIPCVRLDERWALNMTLDRLYELGHRDIAYLGRMRDDAHYSTRDRRESFVRGMRARGLEPLLESPEPVLNGTDDAVWQMVQSLRRRRKPVTAIIFYGAGSARRVLRVMERRCDDVPAKLSLAVAQVRPPLEFETQPLGGVEQDMHAVGHAAAMEMLAALAGRRAPRGRLLRGRWRDGETVAARMRV